MIGRRGVYQEIVRRILEAGLHAAENVPQVSGELQEIRVRQRRKIVVVPAGGKHHLKREPGRVRTPGHEVVIDQHQAPVFLHLLGDDIAEDATLLYLVMLTRAFQFQRDRAGRYRGRDKLRVRMCQRGAGPCRGYGISGCTSGGCRGKINQSFPVDPKDGRDLLTPDPADFVVIGWIQR